MRDSTLARGRVNGIQRYIPAVLLILLLATAGEVAGYAFGEGGAS